MFGNNNNSNNMGAPMPSGVPAPGNGFMSDPNSQFPNNNPQSFPPAPTPGPLPQQPAAPLPPSAPPVNNDFSAPQPVDPSSVNFNPSPDASFATPLPTAPQGPPASADDLMEIKQQALQSLTPLVNHLGQTPEEKFKTTMMMIQATDNSALIKDAYELANQIQDEKARAQALLDVVNEINYFNSQDHKQQ